MSVYVFEYCVWNCDWCVWIYWSVRVCGVWGVYVGERVRGGGE